MEERSEFIEKKLTDTLAQREEVDKKSAQYDELTRAIEESQGQLNSVHKQISAYKNITSLLQKEMTFSKYGWSNLRRRGESSESRRNHPK